MEYHRVDICLDNRKPCLLTNEGTRLDGSKSWVIMVVIAAMKMLRVQ